MKASQQNDLSRHLHTDAAGGARVNHHIKLLGLLLITSLTAACIPYPHQKTRAPEIHGQLLSAGQPISGADVHLHLALDKPDQCTQSPIHTKTDATGHFHFDAHRQQHWVAMPASTIANWALCIEYQQRSIPGWFNSTMKLSDDAVSLHCDIDTTAMSRSPFGMACDVDDSTPASKQP